MTSNGRTFASDAQPYPRRRNDWERLADFAADLRDQHVEQAPKWMVDGRMTEADATARERRLIALAEIWRRICANEALPHVADCIDLGAPIAQLASETANFAAHAADRARARPSDPAARERAQLTEALAWHLKPVAPGALPHIWIAADFARWQHTRDTSLKAA